MSPLLISGVKPTSMPHVGNYIGALAQWKQLQHEYRCRFFIADLHAITVPQDPGHLRQLTLDVLAIYLAIGVDPKLASFFIQSEVPAHAELQWLLCTIAKLGEMERMTQFKDKAQKGGRESAGMGLLSYPILMAADILLYDAEVVPVGDDQVQHLELTRDLAKRFNERFGETFRLPKALTQKEGARIMSLANGEKKMSKSDEQTYGTIFLDDSADDIRRKVKRAVTDTDGTIRFDKEAKPAVSNLLTIFSHMTGETIEALEKRFDGQGYGAFKDGLAEAIVEHFAPVREKLEQYRNDPSYLHAVLDAGRDEAQEAASAKLRLVKERMGIGR